VPTIDELLSIDEERAVEAIAVYIRGLCEQHSADGIQMGLSGGIDSAVLAALAVRAVGKDSVHAAYLYDRESGKELNASARLVADWLGLGLETEDMEPALREKGVYSSWVTRVTTVSRFVNRLFYKHRYLVRRVMRRFMPMPRFDAFGFSARHTRRREILEEKAAARNLVFLGAANRSEWLVGWFVKGGVDDVPLQPLTGLYKTQVRQVAAYLGMPHKIQTQPPSPDMLKGVTDEYALGISYGKLDAVLDHLEGGLSRDDLTSVGITEKEIELVRELNRTSVKKRHLVDNPPPVDGGATGGFRVRSAKTE
jgi:NAD+ synthase